jgi:hypothetical protein
VIRSRKEEELKGWFSWDGGNLINNYSIREFCDVKIPIIMFDKESNFAVMRLEEVSTTPSIPTPKAY